MTTIGATHNALLARAAKQHLGAIGMQRKGQSRVWFKDKGWWLGVVEFQPSSWAKGSHLNVAAMWLWYAQSHYTFHEGGRVEAFHEFVDADQFAVVAERLAIRARDETLELSRRFHSIASAAAHLGQQSDRNPWDNYHAAMAALASGAVEQAQIRFGAMLAFDGAWPFMDTLKAKARILSERAASTASPAAVVADEVAQCRKLLKLRPVDEAMLWRSESQ